MRHPLALPPLVGLALPEPVYQSAKNPCNRPCALKIAVIDSKSVFSPTSVWIIFL
jgi:hypothetical protein